MSGAPTHNLVYPSPVLTSWLPESQLPRQVFSCSNLQSQRHNRSLMGVDARAIPAIDWGPKHCIPGGALAHHHGQK